MRGLDRPLTLVYNKVEMATIHRSVAVRDPDWERLKILSVKARKPVTIIIKELLDFYESHRENGRGTGEGEDGGREES